MFFIPEQFLLQNQFWFITVTIIAGCFFLAILLIKDKFWETRRTYQWATVAIMFSITLWILASASHLAENAKVVEQPRKWDCVQPTKETISCVLAPKGK